MKVLVGVGNYSGYDDSVGLRVIEHISEKGLDTDFRAVDLSANSLNLFAYLDPSVEALLIVDSARMGKKPGEFLFFAPGQVESRKELAGFSTHEGDLLKVLELARATGAHIPPILFMGIEPESLKNEMGLSKTLEDRIPEYAAAAIGRLRSSFEKPQE
ncbi:MAG TPA: hypothetical protein DCM05_10525 [Elusimicrobia bacterium]|nr:hypothetical protein [Elusimicrobiota bacterium]